MNLTLLNEKFENCSCGRKHICPIDYVKIGNGAINTLPLLCKKYSNILLVCDNNTYSVCGKEVKTILEGKFDFAIIDNSTTKRGLTTIALHKTKLILAVGKSHHLALKKKLREQKAVLFPANLKQALRLCPLTFF